MGRAISESSFLVSVGGYNESLYFSGKSGGELKASSSSYNDGITRKNMKIIGNTEVGAITLTRAYDTEVDPAFCKFLDSYCSKENGDLTISVQSIDKCTAASPIGAPILYTGVQTTGYSTPDVKREGNGAAMITYTFEADNVEFQ